METQLPKPADSFTILVVEDEVMLRMVAVETLRDAGYNVLEAGDGDAALDILKTNENVELLISDVKMPGMNGYQLVEAGTALRPKLKVLLMTGYAHEPIPAAITKAGIKMLYKPFDIDQFASLTAQYLKKA